MVEVERLESGVLLYHWVGNVTMQEAKNVLGLIASLLDTPHYAVIIDMRKIKTIPNDIFQMRENIKAELKYGLKGYVILGAPMIVGSFVKMLAPLAPTTYKFANTLDEAIQMARELIR